MPQEDGAKIPVKPFKAYDPGFVHVDVKYLPQMPDEDHRQYLFAAIDRATRRIYVELLQDKSAASAGGFLTRLNRQGPLHDHLMVRNLPTASVPPASASPRVPTRLIASAPPTASNIA